MKSFTIITLGLGLVSAQSVAPAPIAVNGGAIDPNLLANSSAVDPNAVDPNAFDPNSISAGSLNDGSGYENSLDLSGLDGNSLDLSSLDVNGLDLSSIDLSNQNDIIEAIEAMLEVLCLGNAIEEEQLLELGQSEDLEMFAELAQLMELEQSGLLNSIDIQSLFSENDLFSGFSLAGFKRAIAEQKQVCFFFFFLSSMYCAGC